LLLTAIKVCSIFLHDDILAKILEIDLGLRELRQNGAAHKCFFMNFNKGLEYATTAIL
jgi:hypothetical protein